MKISSCIGDTCGLLTFLLGFEYGSFICKVIYFEVYAQTETLLEIEGAMMLRILLAGLFWYFFKIYIRHKKPLVKISKVHSTFDY